MGGRNNKLSNQKGQDPNRLGLLLPKKIRNIRIIRQIYIKSSLFQYLNKPNTYVRILIDYLSKYYTS